MVRDRVRARARVRVRVRVRARVRVRVRVSPSPNPSPNLELRGRVVRRGRCLVGVGLIRRLGGGPPRVVRVSVPP